jgi:hypothetical protein
MPLDLYSRIVLYFAILVEHVGLFDALCTLNASVGVRQCNISNN